jgi:hypothetical protein
LAISRRFPGWGQIAPVYAVIVLILYTWTILWFFWKIPSWLLFMNIQELLSAFAYALATNLLESLAVLSALILASMILPGRWFKDLFVARGAMLAAAGLGWMIFVANQFKIKADYPGWLIDLSPLVLVGIILLVVAAGAIPSVRRTIEALAVRLTVFLFLSIPLSVLALFIVGIQSLV